jgi:hypothetical protein
MKGVWMVFDGYINQIHPTPQSVYQSMPAAYYYRKDITSLPNDVSRFRSENEGRGGIQKKAPPRSGVGFPVNNYKEL